MSGPDYIYFLQSKDRKFWGISDAGDVVLSNKSYPLLFSPDGWLETAIENARNKKYFAIDRTASNPFKYVEDGARILKHIFYTKGVEESVYLVVLQQRLEYIPGVSYGYWYKQIIRTEVDMSTFNHAGEYVTASTVEEGLAKHLRANENTVYEIPMNVPEAVYSKNDGILLVMKQNYSFLSDYTFGANDFTDSAISLTMTTNEGRAPYIGLFSQNYEIFAKNNDPFEYIVDSPNYFLKNTGPDPIDITLKGTLKVNVTELKDVNVIGLLLWNVESDATLSNNHWQRMNPVDGTVDVSGYREVVTTVGIHDVVFNSTITVNPGARLFLEYRRDPFSDPGDLMLFKFEVESFLTIGFQARFETTYTRWLRPQYIFSKLVELVTGGEYSAEDCPYFNSFNNWDKVFSSGDGIRGIEDPKLKISFSQFFDFWNVYDEAGIREKNGKVLLARKKDLIDFVNTKDLGSLVARPVITFDKELPFNEIAIGYPDLQNEDGYVNGKNEFNTTSTYSLGTTKNPRKYEKTTTVRTSCYDIENLRIEQAQKDSTDNKNDNEVFSLHISSTLIPASGDIPSHYEIDRSLNPYLTGVDQKESIFNVIFSPKRCLLRSGDYLRSILYKSDNRVLKFISTNRNPNMAYSHLSESIVENADVVIGDLDAPFMYPVIVSKEVDPPEDILDDMDDNPILAFTFDFEGNTYKVIPVKNSINPIGRSQTYESWFAADNDLKPLIDYYG